METKIEVGFSLTINLGNYNSSKVSASASTVIDSIDELDSAFDLIFGKLKNKITEAIRAHILINK